jgi:N-carbamoyl-L-amino-acid hydrolase
MHREMKLKIDTTEFLRDLDELRTIGAYKTGVHRPTYSPHDIESRHWLMNRMSSVGLEPTMDGIGNVLGRGNGGGPRLLVGSHIETQNHAGWLDGALGVVAGLALARAGLNVDVCAYADEEGHFGSFLGSRSFVGDLSEAQIDEAKNSDGMPLRVALEAAGLKGVERVTIEPGRYAAALELHIEQGTQIEKAGNHIGVVTGIVAVQHWRIVIDGKQDHTGGTRMDERRDAGLSAVRLLAAIDDAFPRLCSEDTVWTAGRLVLQPNTALIIPGRAEIDFTFRDLSEAVMARLADCLSLLVQENNRREPTVARLERISALEPTPCDPAIIAAFIHAASEACPDGWQSMQSGAIHDSKIIGRLLPVGMLFVPSIGGVSHHWTEDTDRSDLAVGIEVFGAGARAILQL